MTSDKNTISGVSLVKASDKPGIEDNVTINVKFSVTGALREAFTERNWEKAYNNHDNTFKLRYGVKLHTGGLRKKEIGKPLDTYKKVALFWTRNPKLTQIGEKKIWVQISKNFEPIIPNSQSEAQQIFLDFDEKMQFSASELGVGKHKIEAEVYVSWFKHDYAEPFDETVRSKEIEIEVTK
ncbi:MAG: hypothetical protein PXX83_09630 [Candidatus Nitrosotalea sp.]|nr:hypothetical protein [Candidatus Nitrosotalea sp.]